MNDPISEVAWESPSGPKYDWQAIADQLREHPMEWGLVYELGPSSTANAIRQGSIRALRKHLGFEIRTRNNTQTSPRTCSLYLRYNPDEDTEI